MNLSAYLSRNALFEKCNSFADALFYIFCKYFKINPMSESSGYAFELRFTNI